MKNKKIKSLAIITALAMAATPIMGISAFADEFDDAIIFEDVSASSYTSAQQAAYTAITQACTEFLNSSVSLSTNYFKVIQLNEGLSKAEIEQLVLDIKASGNYPVLAGVNPYSTAGTDTYDKLALLTKEEYRTAAGRETAKVAKKPVITSAVASDKKVTVTWNEVEGATLYKIWKYVNGNYVKIGETTNTTFTANGLTNGTKYGFVVRAVVNGVMTPFTEDDIVYATPQN